MSDDPKEDAPDAPTAAPLVSTETPPKTPRPRPPPSPAFLAHTFRVGHAPPGPGRPKGVRERIKALTNNGADILETWVGCMKGQLGGVQVRPRERLEASKYLADRLWGKPLETQLLLDGREEGALSGALEPDTLTALARALLPSASVSVRVPEESDAEYLPAAQPAATPDE